MVNQQNVNILHKLHNRELTGRVSGVANPRVYNVFWATVIVVTIVISVLCLFICFPIILPQNLDHSPGHTTALPPRTRTKTIISSGSNFFKYLCIIFLYYDMSELAFLTHNSTPGAPLQKACTYRLFEGETITCDLQLVISETGESDRIVVLGVPVNSEEESRQCLVSILPSPDRMIQSQMEMQGDEFFVHFKYEVQPPYPPFSPVLSASQISNLTCLDIGFYGTKISERRW
eukprot:sb/3469392/